MMDLVNFRLKNQEYKDYNEYRKLVFIFLVALKHAT